MTANASDARRSFSDHVIALEAALKEKTISDCYADLLATLDGVGGKPWTPGLADSGIPMALSEHWYTRLASAISRFIADDATTLNFEQVREISRRKTKITYIFNASGYRHMGHVLQQTGRVEGSQVTLPRHKVAVYYAFVGLDDLNDELMDLALQQSADLLLVLMLGWLNQRAVLTEQGERNRSKLLTSGYLIENVSISDREVEQVVNGWMYSSYADCPKKHGIKTSFNVLLKRLMTDARIAPTLTARERSARPRVVIVLERFVKAHAMFRCYAPVITTLKAKFELVAIAEEMWIDDAADDLFDKVIRLKDGTQNIRAIVELITELKPAIIYYPSLGMSHWTVMIAQLRLAEIQIMSHGHPATSMSSAIDYAYVCELEGDLAAIHSERLLVGSKFGTFMPHSELPAELPALALPSDREVRIAVNSKVMKLSYRLIDICKRVTENASVPVRFSFFPGERGIFFDGLVSAIKSQLPQAHVEPYSDYETFLAQICRCDFALAAFPFGNTNSTVDACLLGLPTIAHFGPESPAQTDKMVLLTAGYPEWLIAKSDDEYYEKALTLIHSPQKRAELTHGLSRERVRKNLFDLGERDRAAEPFADMFWHVYENHEIIQSSDQRVFHYKDVLKTGAP